MKPSDPSFEDVEPLPTYFDTASALGVAAIATMPVILVLAIAQAVDAIAPVTSIVAPLAFVVSLLWRTSKRAKLSSGTPQRTATLRYDLVYAIAFGCVTPMLLLPASMMYAPISAALAGPILLVLAVSAGAALLLIRRRQRADPSAPGSSRPARTSAGDQ